MSSQLFYAFMAFFAIMNPISNLPAYMALVADDSQKISRKIAFRSLLIAFVIITVFIFSGDFIFKVFGITIVSFRCFFQNCWWNISGRYRLSYD